MLSSIIKISSSLGDWIKFSKNPVHVKQWTEFGKQTVFFSLGIQLIVAFLSMGLANFELAISFVNAESYKKTYRNKQLEPPKDFQITLGFK